MDNKKNDKTLIFSESPFGSLATEVVYDNDCSYMYLYQRDLMSPETPIKTICACWIKNHVKVADDYNPVDDASKSIQPKAPTTHVKNPEDLALFAKEDLSVSWGEEGCMAGLYNKGELVCVVPYWVSPNMPGYTAYANSDKLEYYPMQLEEGNILFNKIATGKDFWHSDFNKMFVEYEAKYISDLEKKYGKNIGYFSIDGGKFPPKRISLHEKDGYRYAFTIGLGLYVQPAVEIFIQEFKNFEKIELGFSYKADFAFDESKVLSQLSAVAAVPWNYVTFLNNYMSFGFVLNDEMQKAVLIADKNLTDGERTDMIVEKNINLLWVVPINEEVFAKLNSEESDYSYVDTLTSFAQIQYK